MGTTDHSAANSAVQNLQNKTTSPLSGSIGFGGDNKPEDVFKVSEALVANGRLEQPTSEATDAFNSKIISAQQDMADGLKPDTWINLTGSDQEVKDNLSELSKKYRAKGYTRAAGNLDHFLGGTGKDITITRDEARKNPFVAEAEKENRERFETRTFLGETEDNTKLNDGLRNLIDGETIDLTDDWDNIRDDTATRSDMLSHDLHKRDDALAEGVKNFPSVADFTATRRGNKIFIRGTVKHGGKDTYDFESDSLGQLMGAKRLSDVNPPLAKEFETIREWGQAFEGTVDVSTGSDGNELSNPQITWRDTWKDVDPNPKMP